MDILYISGSPRNKSNTDYLLNLIHKQTGGEFIKLADHDIEPCNSCWACVEEDSCIVDDDMSNIIMPRLLEADGLVVGTPVYFNNVTAQLKCFIDRTWSIRGHLKNKVAGSVVVGRRYGAEGAILALHAFFLKHEMIVANRGVSGIAFESGEVEKDTESLDACSRMASRFKELITKFKKPD